MPSYHPIVEPDCNGFWQATINSLLPSTLLQSILAIVFLFFQGVMLNRIVIKHRLTKAYTLFPGMFYILFLSFFFEHLSFSTYLLGNFFVLLSLGSSFSLYKKFQPEVELFQSGFWSGLASLVSPIYLPVLAVNIAALSSLRSFNMKELLQILLGFASPFFIAFSLTYFFQDTLFWSQLFNLQFATWPTFALSSYWIFISIILLFILIFALSNTTYLLRKSLPAKKKVSLTYILLLTSAFVLLVNCHLEINLLYYLWIPFSIFMSMFIINFKNMVLAEVLHLIFVAVLVNNHFQIAQLF